MAHICANSGIPVKNTVNDFLAVPNFPHAKPIQIARLPLERKQGDEGHNNILFKARIDTGQRWLGHLTGAFNDELISTMFLNADQRITTKTIRQCYSTQLRLGPEESASLKSFAGLNDRKYEIFNRMLFHLLGV